MAIRAGATHVDLYNEAEIVYLYDERHRAALRKRGAADLLVDHGPANAKKLAAIAREGTIVAYLLAGDDPVVADVVVGPPLSKKEMAGARWLKPQQAFLSLPSGTLCIETVNSLHIGPGRAQDAMPGGRVDVPPGDYVMTLHRIDDVLPADDSPPDGYPTQFITLTPVAELPPPAERRAVLTWLDAAGLQREPVATKRLRDGVVFEGTLAVSQGLDSAESDLDLGDAKALHLRWGMRLGIEVGERKYEAVYLAHMNASYHHTLFGRDVAERSWTAPRPALIAYFRYSTIALKDVLRIEGNEKPLAIEGGPLNPATATFPVAFTLRVLPNPVMSAPDPALLRPPSLEGRSLRAVVLHCGDAVVAIGAGRKDFKKIGVSGGGALLARFANGDERVLHWDPKMGGGWKQKLVEEFGMLPSSEEPHVRKLERKAAKLFGKYVMDFDLQEKSSPAAMSLKDESDGLNEQVHALRFPPDKLSGVPLVLKEIHHWEANTPIVIAEPLVGPRNHLGAAVGSDVVLTKRG